ncbi:MAG: GYF domain-containing protein [Verrucomicrobiia bacterium]
MSDEPEDSKLPPIPEDIAEASRAAGREYTIIGGDGAEYGPRSLADLKRWVETDRADAKSLARTSAANDWQRLDQFPELAECLSQSGPPMQSPARPGKFQAVAVMTLVGGIVSLLWTLIVAWAGLSSLLFVCCFIPSGLYSFIAGILITVQGARLLGQNAGPILPRTASAATLLIVCILAFNPICLVLGVINHWLLNDAEVREYVAAHSRKSAV